MKHRLLCKSFLKRVQIQVKSVLAGKTRTLFNNGRGQILPLVLFFIGLSSLSLLFMMKNLNFQFKSTAKVKSLQDEASFRQILRYMDSLDCKETFDGISIGGGITKLKDKDGLVIFDIAKQRSKVFEVVKMEVKNDSNGDLSMFFYYKRSGTFTDKQSTNECSRSNTSGCFSDSCKMVSSTGGTPVGDCAFLSCTGGDHLKVAKPQCFKVPHPGADDYDKQTLIGCGINMENQNSKLAYGFEAGESNGNNQNVFIGYGAGQGSGGDKNVFIGYEAGKDSRGNDNVFLGYGAGSSNTTGSNNVFLGYGAGQGSPISNGIIIKAEDSSINVGNSGFIKVGSGGEIKVKSTPTDFIRFTDGGTEDMKVTDGNKIELNGKTMILKSNVSLPSKVIFKIDRIVLENGEIVIPTQAQISNYITNAVYDHENIRDDHPGYAVADPNGRGHSANCPDAGCCSDRRLKKNIRVLDGEESLQQIADLKPVSFYWKDRGFPPGEQLGFIAQDVRTTIPQLVNENQNGNHGHGEPLLGLNYAGLTPVIVSALKNLVETWAGYKTQLGNLFDEIKMDEERIMTEADELTELETETLALSLKIKKMRDENQSLKKRFLKIKNNQ